MLKISSSHFIAIRDHGEKSYPNEGAGLLLGRVEEQHKTVVDLLPLENQWQEGEQERRYLITPEMMMRAETEAAERGLDIIGIFHSHPDHAEEPSIYDREWALPWYSYIITRVEDGRAILSRAWLLKADRSGFDEESIDIVYPVRQAGFLARIRQWLKGLRQPRNFHINRSPQPTATTSLLSKETL
ncbi:MAG: M67 family metallopeptidase [Candidatus Promineifilaceae bacterium]